MRYWIFDILVDKRRKRYPLGTVERGLQKMPVFVPDWRLVVIGVSLETAGVLFSTVRVCLRSPGTKDFGNPESTHFVEF